MGDGPLVSVIIPAYNCGPYLNDTIDSVLRQTHPNLETIVVDDGSTDDTPERVRQYGAAVSYIRQDNAGVGAARNAGLRAASGDYIAFLDDDDLWLPEKLSMQLAVAARHPNSGLVACDGVQFDGDNILSSRLLHGPTADGLNAASDGAITVRRFYRELLASKGVIACPAQTLIPRYVVDRVGNQSTERGRCSPLPDHDYHARIARHYPVTLHRHSLVRWRYRPSSMSGPADRRHLVWELGEIEVLIREVHRCRMEDRQFVGTLLRQVARKSARAACDFGLRHDSAYARAHAACLVRLLPREPYAILAYLALHCPPSFVEQARRLFRAIRTASCAR